MTTTILAASRAMLLDQFRRSLRARNVAKRTVETYLWAVEGFAAFLETQGMPLQPRHIKREHIEAYI